MSDKRRVRIVNDGQPGYMTQILDADTGQPIDWQTYHVALSAGLHEETKAIIVVHMPVIDVIVDAEILHICPCCGREVENDK